MSSKIIFILPYPLHEAPSQRFRFEQYINILKKKGYQCEFYPFFDHETWAILYKNGFTFKKFSGMLIGYFKRFMLLFYITDCDYVFIHREAAPVGPAFLEMLIVKLLRKKVIYDFDDAIWMGQEGQNLFLTNIIKHPRKVRSIIKLAWKVSAGNQYLADFASQYNSRVIVNPTTIDTDNQHNLLKQHSEKQLAVIGWTGSHTTLVFLEHALPYLEELYKRVKFKLLIISNRNILKKYEFAEFLLWNKETEIEDLLKMDIGIMPLPDSPWTRGKCGFKALQYMSLGIPALVSPVGVNSNIIDHGINGYICNQKEDWINYLKILIENPEKRAEMGIKAREKVETEYSVKSNTENFLRLFS